MAQSNDPFGLGASGISPEMQAEYRGLTRQQAIAEALMKQGMAPGGDTINAGKYLVRRSPLEGIAKVLQAYMGRKQLGDVDTKMADLGRRHQEATAADLGNFMQVRNGVAAKPEIPMPSEELGGGPGRDAMPAVPGDPMGAISKFGNSRNAVVQALIKSDITKQAEMDKERFKAGLPEKPKNQVVGEGGTLIGPDGKAIFSAPQRTVPVAPGGSIASGGKIIATAPPQQMRPGDLASISNAYGSLMKAWDETGNPELLPQIAQLRSQMVQMQAQMTPHTAPAAGGSAPALAPGIAPTAPNAPVASPAAPQAPYRAVAPDAAAAEAMVRELDAKGQLASISTKPLLSNKATRDIAIAAARAVGTQDTRPPSAAAQNAILEADNTVLATRQVIDYIKQARALNDKAMGFPGASIVASAGSFLPEIIRPATVNQTQEMDNIIQTSVLPNLKSTFGGNPTEGERKILLEVAGSSNKNPAVREGIFKRAEKAAKERMEFNEKRANDLRVGAYFTGGNDRRAPAAPAERGARRYNPATKQIE